MGPPRKEKVYGVNFGTSTLSVRSLVRLTVKKGSTRGLSGQVADDGTRVLLPRLLTRRAGPATPTYGFS